METRQLTAEEVTFTLTIEQDDTPVRGNAMASGDDDQDKAVEDEILSRLDAGDTWAWCQVRVAARYRNFTGTSYLCGCSYQDEAGFKADGCYEDMCAAALDALNDAIQETANAIPWEE